MIAMIVLLPIFGARAALFRFRVGRTKTFRVEFSEDQGRWQSNDDDFWKPLKEFFRL